jgi:hypothetical protein
LANLIEYAVVGVSVGDAFEILSYYFELFSALFIAIFFEFANTFVNLLHFEEEMLLGLIRKRIKTLMLSLRTLAATPGLVNCHVWIICIRAS